MSVSELDLVGEAELERALGLILTPGSAEAVLAAVRAIPAGERACYRFSHEVVLALSAASEEFAATAVARWGRTAEEMERIAEEQRGFRLWLAACGGEPVRASLQVSDCLVDMRSRHPDTLVYACPAGEDVVAVTAS